MDGVGRIRCSERRFKARFANLFFRQIPAFRQSPAHHAWQHRPGKADAADFPESKTCICEDITATTRAAACALNDRWRGSGHQGLSRGVWIDPRTGNASHDNRAPGEARPCAGHCGKPHDRRSAAGAVILGCGTRRGDKQIRQRGIHTITNETADAGGVVLAGWYNPPPRNRRNACRTCGLTSAYRDRHSHGCGPRVCPREGGEAARRIGR